VFESRYLYGDVCAEELGSYAIRHLPDVCPSASPCHATHLPYTRTSILEWDGRSKGSGIMIMLLGIESHSSFRQSVVAAMRLSASLPETHTVRTYALKMNDWRRYVCAELAASQNGLSHCFMWSLCGSLLYLRKPLLGICVAERRRRRQNVCSEGICYPRHVARRSCLIHYQIRGQRCLASFLKMYKPTKGAEGEECCTQLCLSPVLCTATPIPTNLLRGKQGGEDRPVL
jgi:hypothetical protein